MTRRRGNRSRQRQERDPYVKRARQEGLRSRAVFKLEQIDTKATLIKPGMVCVDLGSAPGSWSQYAARKIGESGTLIAVDLLPMDALPNVDFIQGDFTTQEILDALLEKLGERRVGLVMSDMAPNLSGNRAIDQPRSMHLAELALDFAEEVLAGKGSFLCKVFQGQGFEPFVAALRARFGEVRIVKPAASRASSSEVYVVARNYRL